jgi:hypothetical protein
MLPQLPSSRRNNQHTPYTAAAAGSTAAAAALLTHNTHGLLCLLMKHSQAASCPQAQHNAHTGHVAQGTECQGVDSGEACSTSSSTATA